MSAANLMRLVLLGEVALYAIVSFLLLRAGCQAGNIALVVVVLLLGRRGIAIAGTYVIAAANRFPLPGDRKLGWFAFLRMVLTDFAAFVVMFSIVQPFERIFLGGDRLVPVQIGRLPVLLLHGYRSNRGAWFWQRRRLERAGWVVATINLEPVFASIDDYVGQVRQRIEDICVATGAGQVILVGHSMGGLVARAYLRAHGTARVAKLITLGTPHHGSRLAKFGPGLNARQMEPDSDWLATLNRPGGSPLPAHTVSARSLYDSYVIPQDSPLLAGARDIEIGAVGHQAMVLVPATTRILLAELSQSC
jgi:triacylglycerol lipase